MWVIVATIVVFAIIFVLMIQKVNFGVSLIIGSILLGLLTLSIQALIETILKALLDPILMELAASVFMITSLGVLYQETEKLKEMTENLEKIISDKRVISMAVPALFGMLPMLGGALLSAPAVNMEGEKLEMSNTRRAFVNVWFRHTIMFISPVGSLIILAVHLSGVSVPLIALCGLPTFIAAVVSGYVIGFRKVDVHRQKESISKHSVGNVLLLLSPIIVAIILNAIVGLKTFISVAAGLLLLILISKPSVKTIYSTIRKANLPRMILAMVAAMIFRGVIYSSQLPVTVSNLMQGASIPQIILTIIIPLTLGYFGGTPTIPVTMSIPILSAISSLNPLSVGLIYSSSLLGYIVSPLHLCLIVTIEYFKSRTIDVYRLLIPAALATITVTALTAFFISY